MPVDGVVPTAWRDAVIDERDRIERIPYELCVLVSLRDALRRREVYVADGNRPRLFIGQELNWHSPALSGLHPPTAAEPQRADFSNPSKPVNKQIRRTGA
ncbi:hypothetical protein FHR84_004010 [Actinopolyspora biskrensis]|uniref:Uncharacterized protein n=1 Tax=Actinopolyspora biskrensis TaxID=1470178 RepID=A0A852Z046_9ACTN|nr:hypothetical protein [Actinopolyspora biskrensis]NYH80644.1 hypothetical protein [Actinopolyspora biskrensis]